MPKVFISHSWIDNDISRKIANDLKRDGAEIWIDYAGISGGESLPDRISQALEWCDTLVLVWSNSAAISKWVNKEWTSALSLDKTIIPCILDDAKLPAILSSLLYIDFSNFDSGYNELCSALRLQNLEEKKKAEAEKLKLEQERLEAERKEKKRLIKLQAVQEREEAEKQLKLQAEQPREKREQERLRLQKTKRQEKEEHGKFYVKQKRRINVGATDKTIRIVIGILLINWGVFSSKIWFIIGLIPLITGLIGYCPLYKLLGISTNKASTEK